MAVLLASGLAALLDGLIHGSIPLQVLGATCLGAGMTIFFVKIAEEIKPVTAKWSIAGEVGEVVEEVGREKTGIVRVRSELWSARSEASIAPGTKVRVIRTEGLLARVAELDEEGVSA